jgi:hypothetical protein
MLIKHHLMSNDRLARAARGNGVGHPPWITRSSREVRCNWQGSKTIRRILAGCRADEGDAGTGGAFRADSRHLAPDRVLAELANPAG